VQFRKSRAIPYAATGRSGEGGIRTHGKVTRKTVFEFEDSRAVTCALVVKRVLQFGISHAMIPACSAARHAVLRGSFANPFANFSPAPVSPPKRTSTKSGHMSGIDPMKGNGCNVC
jgi:hypothetical protein